MKLSPIVCLTLALWLVLLSGSSWAAGEPARGAALFRRACAACHSLQPDRNMTGPSLAGVWGRRAGTLPSFDRYSPALKSADIVWGAGSLDRWLADPAQFIPHSRMTFPGIADARARDDLIAYLKQASASGGSAAQATPQGKMPMGGMMGGMSGARPNLEKLQATEQVTAIRHCRDSYHVTTADGETHDFWEPNLRFKTDSSELGPSSGSPALLPAGMMGDRADVIFAKPEEMSGFIRNQC